MLKYLRIAVTALSLTACVLLIVLWVRSYSRVENLIVRSNSRIVQFSSGLGQLAIEWQPFNAATWPDAPTWQTVSQPAAPIAAQIEKFGGRRPTLKFRQIGNQSIVFMRHWIPVLVTGLLATVCGIPHLRRFSLRTLLIATTLVAVMLAAIIYVAR
jgi:hypothetical protein